MKRSRYVPFLGTLVIAGFVLWLAGVVMAKESAVSGSQTAVPYPDQRHAVKAAVTWLVTARQNSDGGFTSFSTGADVAPSDVAGTLDGMLALAAAGYPSNVPYPGRENGPLHFLQANEATVANYAGQNGGRAGKLLLGLTAAGQNPRDFGEYNFVISLTQQLSPTGQYNTNTAFNQSLAILGLTAVSGTVPLTASQWLVSQQAVGGDLDGSWDDGFGTTGNSDSTAMAIMALVAAGMPVSDTVLVRATDFLSRTQLPTGGWEYGLGFGENANSTALVIQALRALGIDTSATDSSWSRNGRSLVNLLLGYQSGAGAFESDFGFGPFADFFATVQAVPGAAGKTFPLPTPYEAARQAISCLSTLQDPTTGGWEQFAGFGINAGGTARAIEAIAAFGDDPQSDRWTVNNINAVEALETLAPSYLDGSRGGRVGIVMQGVVAAGVPYEVANFASINLVVSMTAALDESGRYDDTAFGPFAHNEAMLGLLAAGLTPDESAITWLWQAQEAGDWGSADSNGTALNALGQVGRRGPATWQVLHNTQFPDSGWGFAPPAGVNATSEVVQGLAAQGQNPFGPDWSTVVSGTIINPADAVLSQQLASGCWAAFGGGDGPSTTVDAILMLMTSPGWPVESYLPLVLK